MTIILRVDKGSALTHNEMDQNFIDIRDGVNIMVPKIINSGIKVDSLGTPSYPWHDIIGFLQVFGDAGDATRNVYRGGLKALQFDETDSAYCDFHLPHDYVMGSDIFIHVHWSHDSEFVTGGSVTWGFEYMYAKGHNQAPFSAPQIESVVQNVSTAQYQHMVAETQASTAGGSGTQIDTSLIEPDGLIQCRLYLDSNDITVSSGLVPNPFAHTVDIHYQSTTVGTKQRSPDFWT